MDSVAKRDNRRKDPTQRRWLYNSWWRIATVAPWVTYCLIYYRKEFLWEHKRVLDHLNTDVESWGASWDRPLFDYMPLFYPVFYAALFAAVLCLLVVMFKRWNLAELFVLAWGIGVIVPHTLAETKTPSATMIAVSPLLICLAAVISRAWQRRDWVYTGIWSCRECLRLRSSLADGVWSRGETSSMD